MKYAVFADLHLGSGHEDIRAYTLLQAYRSAGYRIIFAGDTFDTWRNKNAPDRYAHYVEENDILLVGNHDYGLGSVNRVPTHNGSITVTSGDKRVFLTHGDCVDFWYAASLLERASNGETEGIPWLARLLSRFRKWKVQDVFSFYKAMRLMPEWAVKAVEHQRPWAQKLRGLAVTMAFLVACFMRRERRVVAGPPAVSGEVLDQFPRELAHRIQGFHPQAKQADTIIMGHLHRPIRSKIGGGRELIVAGAFVRDVEPTVVTIEEGTIEVHKL